MASALMCRAVAVAVCVPSGLPAVRHAHEDRGAGRGDEVAAWSQRQRRGGRAGAGGGGARAGWRCRAPRRAAHRRRSGARRALLGRRTAPVSSEGRRERARAEGADAEVGCCGRGYVASPVAAGNRAETRPQTRRSRAYQMFCERWRVPACLPLASSRTNRAQKGDTLRGAGRVSGVPKRASRMHLSDDTPTRRARPRRAAGDGARDRRAGERTGACRLAGREPQGVRDGTSATEEDTS